MISTYQHPLLLSLLKKQLCMIRSVNKSKVKGGKIMSEDINNLIKVRSDKLNEMKQQGKNPFEVTKFETDTTNIAIKNNFDSYEEKTVKIAGRIITKRIMGKASFCDLKDSTGKIQIYIKRDEIGTDEYSEFKKFDIGDFVGVIGDVFRTHKGEISIRVKQIKLLSKSLRPLPEKFHGLNDQEIRYRQRYLDLIVNDDVKEKFVLRSKIVSCIRKFLSEKGFLEVDTPILQTIPGGANARPFISHHNALNIDMYMRIALELPLKKLIIGGFDKVYEMGRVFRNEGVSIKHNPEFTLLELYQAYADYHDMMDLTEELFRFIAKDVFGTYKIKFADMEIDFEKPSERITMLDAVKKYCGIDFNELDLEQAKKLADERNLQYESYHGKGDILNMFFEEYAEKNLVMPTFLMDHPVEVSPLAKRKPNASDYTERFELFVMGREYGNAYSELNDPQDQRQRFLHQEKLRSAGDDEANMIDEDFLTAMEYGMPPTGGLGIGIDRLVMLFTDSVSIRDVLLFPTMKSVDK